MFKKLKNREQPSPDLEIRRKREQRARNAWTLLEALGISQNEARCKIGKGGKPLDKGHFSRFVHDQVRLSEETTQKLEKFTGEKIKDMIKTIFKFGFAPMEVMAARYAPGVPYNERTEDSIKQVLGGTLGSHLGGRIPSPDVIDGVTAAIVELGDGPIRTRIVLTNESTDNEAGKDALIHEYTHIINLFQDKINKLHDEGERPKFLRPGL